jgi:ketosteroid isomerase-like protein
VELGVVEIWGNADMANVQGKYAATNPQGNLFDKSKFISTWKKDAADRWKITHDIWNSDIPVATSTSD